MSASDKADVEYLNGIFDGFKATMVINAATELELFDLVEEAGDTGTTASQLAQQQGWDAECTERLLNTCVSLKLLHKHTHSPGQDTYQNAGPGQCLIKSTQSSLCGWIPFKHSHVMMSKLSEEVKTGSHKSCVIPQHITVHKPASQQQEEGQGHHHGHHHHCGKGQAPSEESVMVRYKSFDGVCRPYANELVTAFDLGQYKTAVDLGAGSGAVSFELARTYPSMHITLFEVPPVIELVKKYFVPKSEQLDVSLVGGDFTEVVLPKADLYVMAKIVHDWNPQQIASLLSKVYASLNEGGAIMLLEKCLNDNKDGPSMPHLWDMIVMSFCAGRLRSGAEYTSLLEGLGFRDVKIHKTHAMCTYDVIMATK